MFEKTFAITQIFETLGISKKTAGNMRKLPLENKYTIQNNKQSNTYRPSTSIKPTGFVSRNRLKLVRCNNCSGVGHTAQSCIKPINRCDKCSRLEHESHECQQENRNQTNNAKYSPELKNDVKKSITNQPTCRAYFVGR